HQLGKRQRRVLVRRMILDDVGEAFLQLVELVVHELPVARLSGEPDLGMAHLSEGHDLAEPRPLLMPAGRAAQAQGQHYPSRDASLHALLNGGTSLGAANWT